jgi:hypothetical protein
MTLLGSHTCSIKLAVKARCETHAANVLLQPRRGGRGSALSSVAEVAGAFLLLHVHRMSPTAPCTKDSALRPVGLLWPLLTSPTPSRRVAPAVVRCSGQDRRPLEVRRAFFSRTRRIYHAAFRMTIGRPRPWPGYPRHLGLISASCTSRPRFRHRLSSDSASRRTPLLRRMVPVITVHGGLSPLECTSLLDTPS